MPLAPIFLFFLKLGLNTRSLAKIRIIQTTLRVPPKRTKIVYFFKPLKMGIKIKKIRQKCQFLIFFNEIFTVYAVSGVE